MNTLLIVDFDSTFIRDETLDEIANLLLSSNRISKNTQEKITKITNQAMNGELDFRQALKERVKLFINLHPIGIYLLRPHFVTKIVLIIAIIIMWEILELVLILT